MRKRVIGTVLLILAASGTGVSRPAAQRTAQDGLPKIVWGHDAAKLAAAATPFKAAGLPASYDLRDQDKMTAVRNEGSLGGSHAFAALASLESCLLPDETWNFSEKHLLSALAGLNESSDVVGALARWADPIREADDPWPESAKDDPAVKHVQDVIYILPRTSSLDNDRIKQAIMDYGAIWSFLYYTPDLFNAVQSTYYSPQAARSTNRSVAIAGWDDAFDKTRFSPQPPGNGAFLCKNSLGSDWGSGGYFYVSYYDADLARDFSAAVTAEPSSGYTVQYAYDPNGCTGYMGYDTDTAWFAALYTSTSTDPLAAVGFYASSEAGTFDISIYLDASPNEPQSGTLALQQAGSFSRAGFMTIPLTASIPLLLNQRFSVVVKLQTDNVITPIPVEGPRGGAAGFTANPGECFVRRNGEERWDDVTKFSSPLMAQTSVCLKAYAGYPAVYPPLNLKVARLTNNLFFFKEYYDKLTWQANSKNAEAPIKYRVYRKDLAVEGAEFETLGEVSVLRQFFFVRSVKKEDAFLYRVTSVMANGRESDPVEVQI
ncbi:MAG: lectin like domain-containing protein [Acidobacteriota bacterium]|nr:lectin like domain-containing protein [Acidobacteriota bacterium]